VSGLRGLLEDGLPPGVYRWRSAGDPDDARSDVEKSGWNFVLLDTTGVGDRAGFLDVCATAFDLPRWFGRTWDALSESLGDRSTGEPEVVLWMCWENLAVGDLDAFDVALQIFADDALGSGQLRVLLPETEDPDLIPPPLADVRVI
jgi:Barstar (barnase inhibitor)